MRNKGDKASRPVGFSSPAEDYLDHGLDLNTHLIRNPAATFFVRMSGDSMLQAGIHSRDLLIVDRSLDPKQGSIVLATLQGEFVVRRIRFSRDRIRLCPGNPDFSEIRISRDLNACIWGVVTYVIHPLNCEGRGTGGVCA